MRKIFKVPRGHLRSSRIFLNMLCKQSALASFQGRLLTIPSAEFLFEIVIAIPSDAIHGIDDTELCHRFHFAKKDDVAVALSSLGSDSLRYFSKQGILRALKNVPLRKILAKRQTVRLGNSLRIFTAARDERDERESHFLNRCA